MHAPAYYLSRTTHRTPSPPLWLAGCLLSPLSRSQDLKDLDEDALRFRVAQLATEIQERTKWEALRLMEGVQKKEAEIGQKVRE